MDDCCNGIRPTVVGSKSAECDFRNWAPAEADNSSGYRYSRKLRLILRRGGSPIVSIIGAKAHANVSEGYFFNGLQIQLRKNWPNILLLSVVVVACPFWWKPRYLWM